IFLTQVIVDVIVCFAGLSLTFLIGLIFYRYGLVGGFSFLATLFLLFIGSIAKGYFVDLVNYIVNNYTLLVYFVLFGCIVVCYALFFVFSFLSTLFLLFIGSIAKVYFVYLVKYIVNNYTLTIYFALFGCSVVIYAISYFFLRRLTIHSA